MIRRHVNTADRAVVHDEAERRLIVEVFYNRTPALDLRITKARSLPPFTLINQVGTRRACLATSTREVEDLRVEQQ